MSEADIERFVNDVKSNPELLDKIKKAGASIAAVVEIARAHGYDFSLEEAREYNRSQAGSGLSEDELRKISGGSFLTAQVSSKVSQAIEAASAVSSLGEGGSEPTAIVVAN